MATGGSEAWLPQVAPTFEFTDPSRYAVLGLCNVISGEYGIRGATLIISGAGATLKGCYEPDQSRQEWVQNFLILRSTIGTVDGEIVISNPLGYVVMALQG